MSNASLLGNRHQLFADDGKGITTSGRMS